jgi:diguanylate cyclase (GGDEF)-like protein
MADFNLDASTCGQDPDWYASICIISAKGAEPVFGRLGGEEFACLLPHLTLVQGLAIAEDIRSAVTLLPVCYGQEQIRLSVSCSVSSTIDAGQNLEALLSSADDALYRAKRNGRNRVEAASQKAVSDEPIFA